MSSFSDVNNPTPRERIRWLSARVYGWDDLGNDANVCPPGGIGQIVTAITVGGQTVFGLARPRTGKFSIASSEPRVTYSDTDGISADLTLASGFMANGLFNVPQGAGMSATQDWPALVLCDTTPGSVVIGSTVGPTSGSWYVSKDGSGFRVVSLEPSFPAQDGLQAAWISPHFLSITSIRWRNDSTYTVPAYGVMEVTGWDEDEQAWICGRPSGTFRRRYLVNTGTEIEYSASPKNFSTGTWLEEAGKVLLNTSTGATINTEWGAKKDSFSLWANRPGFMLLDYQTVDTAIIGKAIQREVTELIGKLSGSAITSGSTGSVAIWAGASGSEVALEFDAITCRARFGAVANAKWVAMSFRNGVWYCAQIEC